MGVHHEGRRGESHQFWLEGEYLTISVLSHAEPMVMANLKGHRVFPYFYLKSLYYDYLSRLGDQEARYDIGETNLSQMNTLNDLRGRGKIEVRVATIYMIDLFILEKYLFSWLCWLLVAACGILVL